MDPSGPALQAVTRIHRADPEPGATAYLESGSIERIPEREQWQVNRFSSPRGKAISEGVKGVAAVAGWLVVELGPEALRAVLGQPDDTLASPASSASRSRSPSRSTSAGANDMLHGAAYRTAIQLTTSYTSV